MSGSFNVSTRSNGEFQFNLKAGNGQVNPSSESYAAKDPRMSGIESVRKNSQADVRFGRKTANDGQFFFNLTAGNGQVIGTSETYADVSGRDNGIASLRDNAPGATVDDQTG